MPALMTASMHSGRFCDKFNLLLAVRNREVLEWHFKFDLLQNAAWIFIVEDNLSLTASG